MTGGTLAQARPGMARLGKVRQARFGMAWRPRIGGAAASA
jgi:hypothetical protein